MNKQSSKREPGEQQENGYTQTHFSILGGTLGASRIRKLLSKPDDNECSQI